MATNGTLKLQADGSYKGEFYSLKHAFPLQMIENAEAKSERSPTYLIFSGRTRLGAAWEEVSQNGVVYYTVQLKDPSFDAPIYVKLFQDKTDSGTYNVVFD